MVICSYRVKKRNRLKIRLNEMIKNTMQPNICCVSETSAAFVNFMLVKSFLDLDVFFHPFISSFILFELILIAAFFFAHRFIERWKNKLFLNKI